MQLNVRMVRDWMNASLRTRFFDAEQIRVHVIDFT
jgi:hypothetical protein